MSESKKRVIIANPRGFCAGVDRAIDVVELALEVYGKPIYVKHAIVHNKHVILRLEQKGAIFTDELMVIPRGSHVVFSAHGSSLKDFEKANTQGLLIVDATCPLVTKVHLEVERFSREGKDILMVGHKGHVEPQGTLGHAQNVKTTLIETPLDARTIDVRDPNNLAVVTQTTLSVDETKATLAILRERFPKADFPKKEDICYATTNRQAAVLDLVRQAKCIIVIGSRTSSNSNRLVEVAKQNGAEAFLIDDAKELQESMYAGHSVVGVTSGASAPDDLVEEVIAQLVSEGYKQETQNAGIHEDVFFALPHAFVKTVKDIKPDASILHKHAIQKGRSMKV